MGNKQFEQPWSESDLNFGHLTAEMLRGIGLHGPLKSAHEALAILEEEVDELKHEIRKDKGDQAERMRRIAIEAMQVASVAFRIYYSARLAEAAI